MVEGPQSVYHRPLEIQRYPHQEDMLMEEDGCADLDGAQTGPGQSPSGLGALVGNSQQTIDLGYIVEKTMRHAVLGWT